MIHRTCVKEMYKDGTLLYSCGVADNSDLLLPFQYSIVDDGNDGDGDVKEDENNTQDEVMSSAFLNESRKWPSAGNTSSRKKAKIKKGESSMLKKLIEELTSPSSALSTTQNS